MCYSAKLSEAYGKFLRHSGAKISLPEFMRLYGFRQQDRRIRIPRAVDRWFDAPQSEDERAIHAVIEATDAAEVVRLERELFAQKTRLNKAVRVMATKPTKQAAEDQRIASAKIDTATAKLAALRRAEATAADRRFFPGWYVPVMIVVDGDTLVVPMRYGCRPAGKPANYDRRYPGTYNARRDNLERFWRGQFAQCHGVVLADEFFENVAGPDGENRVLRFVPRDRSPLYIACLWSHWTDPAGVLPDLYSFAAITDDPEPEVAAAGHDRTIVNLRPELIEAWLRPGGDAATAQTILDDRQHPGYEWRQAA